jgi:hypothetical protein
VAIDVFVPTIGVMKSTTPFSDRVYIAPDRNYPITLHYAEMKHIDEMFDTLDEEARNRVIMLFNSELKDASIINIGRPET